MIGKLSGKIDLIKSNQCLIDVNGVGYLVFASGRTLSRMGIEGEFTSLMIETHVREDHIHLFGFCDALEQQWFNTLMKVQGVGAKVALSILSITNPQDLSLAIAAQDKAVFSRADGVGPKLAMRIVTELKDKVGGIDLSPTVSHSLGTKNIKATQPDDEASVSEALSALVNLGYGRSEALVALNLAKQKIPAEADLGALIKQGLKELSA